MSYFFRSPQKTFTIKAEGLPSRIYQPYPYKSLDNNALRIAGAKFEQKASIVANGNGLFATEDVPRGDLLFRCRNFAEADEFLSLMNGSIFKPSPNIELRIRTLAALDLSVRSYEAVAERMQNICLTDDGEIRAARRIKKGEELWKNYDCDFWLVELITISDMTTATKRFGDIVAQCLERSAHTTTRQLFPFKTGGKYQSWMDYWNEDGEQVVTYGKALREGNYSSN